MKKFLVLSTALLALASVTPAFAGSAVPSVSAIGGSAGAGVSLFANNGSSIGSVGILNGAWGGNAAASAPAWSNPQVKAVGGDALATVNLTANKGSKILGGGYIFNGARGGSASGYIW